MAIDCEALQAQYDLLAQAYLDLLTGRRTVSVTYGDKTTTYAIASANQLREARDEIAAQLAVSCGTAVVGAKSSRFAQPSMGDGRC